MTKKLIPITILMLLITSMLPGIVLGSSTTLNLNIISAPVGTTVTASGSTDSNTWMSIKILDNTRNIVLSDPFKSDSNGNYSREFKVPNVSPGVSLIVVAGYGSNVANQVLAVTAPGSAVVTADVSEPANPVNSGTDDTTTTTSPVTGNNEESTNNSTGGGGTTTTPAAVQPIVNKPAIALNDVAGIWAEANINKLVAAGVIGGYPDGSFKPNERITRAEFTVVLVKAFKLESQGGQVFSDTASHWAKDYIAIATAKKIVSGYSAANYGPDDYITREQMAVMIVNAAQLTGVTGGKVFNDREQISSWAQDAVSIATANKAISGYPDNTFKPHGSATRAEAVTVIAQVI